jgi:hypothetical protein
VTVGEKTFSPETKRLQLSAEFKLKILDGILVEDLPDHPAQNSISDAS